MSTIGDRIKSTRESKKITQEELAKAAHTTKQTIYKYENGIVTNIPSDKIEAIASYLDVSEAYLMGWETDAITSKEGILIECYRGLNSSSADRLLRYAKSLLELQESENLLDKKKGAP